MDNQKDGVGRIAAKKHQESAREAAKELAKHERLRIPSMAEQLARLIRSNNG